MPIYKFTAKYTWYDKEAKQDKNTVHSGIIRYTTMESDKITEQIKSDFSESITKEAINKLGNNIEYVTGIISYEIVYNITSIWFNNKNQKEETVLYEGTIQTTKTTKHGILEDIKFKDFHASDNLKSSAEKYFEHSDIKFITHYINIDL